MKTGDNIYLFHRGNRYNYVFLRSVPDFDAAVIKNGVGEMRCRNSEIRLKCEVDAEDEAALYAARKEETSATVALWNQGVRTGKEMAERTKLEPKEMTRLIRLAKRCGFIVGVES